MSKKFRPLMVPILLAAVAVLLGCPQPPGVPLTAAEQAIASLSVADFGFPPGVGLAAVTCSFTVPLIKNGATFTWTSSSRFVKKIEITVKAVQDPAAQVNAVLQG